MSGDPTTTPPTPDIPSVDETIVADDDSTLAKAMSGATSSSHAAFVDNFGAIFTVLSCGIAGYQILQHLRYYTQPAI